MAAILDLCVKMMCKLQTDVIIIIIVVDLSTSMHEYMCSGSKVKFSSW